MLSHTCTGHGAHGGGGKAAEHARNQRAHGHEGGGGEGEQEDVANLGQNASQGQLKVAEVDTLVEQRIGQENLKVGTNGQRSGRKIGQNAKISSQE